MQNRLLPLITGWRLVRNLQGVTGMREYKSKLNVNLPRWVLGAPHDTTLPAGVQDEPLLVTP